MATIHTNLPAGHILREPWTFACAPDGTRPLVWSFGRIANWLSIPEDQPRVTVCRAQWWTSSLNNQRRPKTGPTDWWRTNPRTGERIFVRRDPKPVYEMVRISTAKMVAWCLHGIEPDDGQQGPGAPRKAELDARALRALRLREEGKTQQQIADALGVARPTVQSVLARAETLVDTL